MPDYDVIVIGAGNGGLTAAVSLAQQGKKVLLLEKHNVPGGCATSFIRGRFEFEVALHQLSGLGTADKPGPLRPFLDKMGVLDKINWIEMKNLYRVILPDKLDLVLPADRKEMLTVLQEKFPLEKEAIQEFWDFLYTFFLQFISISYKKDAAPSKEKYPLFFKYALKPTQEIFDQYFKDPLLQLAISPYWSYIGVPTEHLSFIDYAALMFSYLEFKPFNIQGGSQKLSNALIEQYLSYGGDVRFNCKAEKIIVDEGRVKGVVTAKGETIEADYVISNISTLVTFTEMIAQEDIPAQQLEIMRGRTVGVSSFTMFIGLDCPPETVGLNETTVFVYNSSETADQISNAWVVETDNDPLLITCYNVSDPEASPPGTCQVVVVDVAYAEPWLRVPPSQYQDTKYQCADTLLKRIEHLFPGFREHIEEIEIATPITHMRYLGSPGGAFYGFDQYPKDSSFFIRPQSFIKGLYMSGAWAGSGGFQPTLMSGGSAAKAVIRDMERRA